VPNHDKHPRFKVLDFLHSIISVTCYLWSCFSSIT